MIGIENVREPEEMKPEENKTMALAREIKPLLEEIRDFATKSGINLEISAEPDGFIGVECGGVKVVAGAKNGDFDIWNGNEFIKTITSKRKESQEEEASQDSK